LCNKLKKPAFGGVWHVFGAVRRTFMQKLPRLWYKKGKRYGF
jgi:hypothetical protein